MSDETNGPEIPDSSGDGKQGKRVYTFKEIWADNCVRSIKEAGIKNPEAVGEALETMKYIIKEMQGYADPPSGELLPKLENKIIGWEIELAIALDALGIEE